MIRPILVVTTSGLAATKMQMRCRLICAPYVMSLLLANGAHLRFLLNDGGGPRRSKVPAYLHIKSLDYCGVCEAPFSAVAVERATSCHPGPV